MVYKKGSSLFFGIVIALFFWIAGIMILPYFQDSVDLFRIDMDCANTSITYGNQASCLIGDGMIPYFIVFLVGTVAGIIAGVSK